MNRDLDRLAAELNEWFEGILGLTEKNLFGIAPEGPHRDAVVLDALIRNARLIQTAGLDRESKLYSPLCFFLAAACRHLNIRLQIGHWRAALRELCDDRKTLTNSIRDSEKFGLNFDSPAIAFKREMDDAMRLAGLIDGTSFLDKEDRQVAIGLAINWGIRFLLAYATEFSQPAYSSARKDLSWLAGRVQSTLAECA